MRLLPLLPALRPVDLRAGFSLRAAGLVAVSGNGPPSQLGTAALSKLTVAELKKELTMRSLPVSGAKSVLIQRLAAQALDRGGSAIAPPAASAASAAVGSSQRSSRRASGPAVLVVESPAKVATISKFLGDGFTVLSCRGHVRQLPSKPGSVVPDRNFTMRFETDPAKERFVAEIARRVEGASALYLAMDPDREGEAIAWHVEQCLVERGSIPPGVTAQRICFGEITKRAVREALASPRAIDMPLVHAQQARQALDYLVGFTLSPVLWRKLPGCRSAGRVQSVALRLVASREEEILRFRREEYWQLGLRLGGRGATAGGSARGSARGAAGRAAGGTAEAARATGGILNAQLSWLGGSKLSKLDLNCELVSNLAESRLASQPEWSVEKIATTQRRLQPQPPYNTASLQMDASRRWPISPICRAPFCHISGFNSPKRVFQTQIGRHVGRMGESWHAEDLSYW